MPTLVLGVLEIHCSYLLRSVVLISLVHAHIGSAVNNAVCFMLGWFSSNVNMYPGSMLISLFHTQTPWSKIILYAHDRTSDSNTRRYYRHMWRITQRSQAMYSGNLLVDYWSVIMTFAPTPEAQLKISRVLAVRCNPLKS